jgi:adenosylcobinamide-GDP ribazoletransferase
MRSFVIAWEFLTAIPLPAANQSPDSKELAGSMSWFPLVGLILGGLLAVTDLLTSVALTPMVVNILIMVVLVIATGGLHIDGLADSIDGLAGGRTPTDRLRIMRDVHLGALGATGLVLALGLRYAGLAALPSSHRLAMLVCMPVVGRWAMVVSSLGMPYARAEGGLAQPFLQQLSIAHFILATLWVGPVLIWSVGLLNAAAMMALVALVARGISALAMRLVGGVTGDILGAANEVAEIAFLIAAPVIVSLELPALAGR